MNPAETPRSPTATPHFSNPLLPAPSQDPWVTCHNGVYLSLITDGCTIYLRHSSRVEDVFAPSPLPVWRAPRIGPASKHLWAPELHRIRERWFIYYAADNGRNRNHRLFVLESTGDDPAGPYHWLGQIETGGWSIDATLLRTDADNLFLLWSGWEGADKGPQNLYVAPLGDPLTLAGPRVLLAQPDQPWEQGGAAIIEGPAVWRRGPLTGVVYSASASWTVHGCLGMLLHRGGDYLDPAAWTKIGPVFRRTPYVWGVGHCSLVDADADHGVIFYHAKTKRTRGWRDRNIRAQSFMWDTNGLPLLAEALPPPSQHGVEQER